jgi:DNA mismatch endonuclease (patch repair protein)
MRSNYARGTKPELAMSRLLHKRLASSSLPGTPDFVYPEEKLTIFVHGCWWHGCPEHYRAPKTHAAFWRRKLERNRERDRLNRRELESMGWRVLEVWEHEIKKDPEAIANRIRDLASHRAL